MGIQINGNNDNISAVDGDLSITGITTFSQFDVGSNIKLGNAGVITATSFVGSGANLTGLTVPGGGTGLDLNDNVKIRLGTGNDCELYHNGTDNFIDATAGNLYLRGPADASKWIILQAHSGENSVVAKPDAAVELYFNGTKKIETLNDGTKVTGTLRFDTSDTAITVADDKKIKFGNSDDLQIYHDASNSYIKDSGTGFLIIESNQLQIKSDTAEKMIVADANGSVELYYDNSKRLQTELWGTRVFATGQDAMLAVQGEANRSCEFRLQADNGNQHADYSRIHKNKDTGKLQIQNYASGSWEDNIVCSNNGNVELYYDNSKKFETQSAGGTLRGTQWVSDCEFVPNANNTYDLGISSLRWRNVYSQDLQLSNEARKDEGGNDVDGTWGDYTIQEGESDLFLINNRNGKKYTFLLKEVT